MADRYLTTMRPKVHDPGARHGKAGMALSVAVLLLLVACGGGASSDTAIEGPTGATAERLRVEGGASTLQSMVRVEFTGDIGLALPEDELAGAIRLRTPGMGAELRAQDVAVAAVSLDEDRSNVLVIRTDGLVPDGTEVRIERRALSEGGSGSVAATVESDLTQVQALLASVAVVPARPELLERGEVASVSDEDGDATAQRRVLEEHLQARGSGDDVVARALDTYETIPREAVPDAKLRAAIAGLTGTFAEPAIDDLLTDGNCTGLPTARVAFEEPPDFPDLLARVTYTGEGARVVSINPVLEGEPVQLLMAILLHEAIHCDRVSEQDEEIAATAFDTYFYLLLVAAEPGIAQAGTLLTQNYNTDALALINSGRTLPESIGVLPGPASFDVLPGTESGFQSFAAYVAASYSQLGEGPSPPEPLAVAYAGELASMLGAEAENPFDLAYLDALLGLSMVTDVLLAALDALWLEPDTP